MPDTQADSDALRHCIEHETNLVTAFINTLEEEAEVLAAGGDADSLASTTAKKNESAEKLEQAARQRNAVLNAMGCGSDKEGLEAAVGKHPELHDLVSQLFDQTARASMLNTSNGRILSHFLAQNQQALDILQHLTGRSDLYDAKGRKRPTTRPDATHIKAR